MKQGGLQRTYLQQLGCAPPVVHILVQTPLQETAELWGPEWQRSKKPKMKIKLLQEGNAVTHQQDGRIRMGGSALAIFSRTLMGFISWLGGSICAISIRVTPSDQMSALQSYGRSFDVSHITTSGAILADRRQVQQYTTKKKGTPTVQNARAFKNQPEPCFVFKEHSPVRRSNERVSPLQRFIIFG